jgi:hypothetical protein
MFTFETADQKEVRRFRIAQFNGRATTIKLGGSTITGHIRSILEKQSSIPQCWTITIVPSAPKAAPRVLRSAARAGAFADEELY